MTCANDITIKAFHYQIKKKTAENQRQREIPQRGQRWSGGNTLLLGKQG